MSAKVISDLFQQIVHSEEKIKQRFEALKKVNQQIQENQEQIRNLRYETQALMGSIAVVNHKLIQEKIENKCLKMKENILEEQKKDTIKELDNIRQEINILETEEQGERSRFLRDCDLFLKMFDITKSDDRESEYEQSVEQKIEQKREHHKSLVDILEVVKEEERAKLGTLEEHQNLMKERDVLVTKKKELQEIMKSIRKEKKHLQTTKENVIKSFNNNTEIQGNAMTESRKKKEKKQTVYEMQLEFKEATEEVVNSFLKHIESYWNRFKLKIEAVRGCRREDLQSYMDEFMWRKEMRNILTVLNNYCKEDLVKQKSFLPLRSHRRLVDELDACKSECAFLSEEHKTLAMQLYQLQQSQMKVDGNQRVGISNSFFRSNISTAGKNQSFTTSNDYEFSSPSNLSKKTDEEIMNLVSIGIDGHEYAQEKSKPKSNPWMFVNTAQPVNRQEANIEPKIKKKRFRFKCSDRVREESRDIKHTDEETSSYFSKTGESLDFQFIDIDENSIDS